jgi:hypothetical protein
VIDRFEEEETRLAQLSGDQMRMLRGSRSRDSSEMPVAPPPPSPSGRSRRPTDEPTTTRPPFPSEEVATMASGIRDQIRDIPPNQSFDSDERTRQVAPPSRRTPVPERVPPKGRPPTQPPPPMPLPGVSREPVPSQSYSQSRSQPSRSRGPTPGPPLPPAPGTVHSKNPNAGLPSPMPGSLAVLPPSNAASGRLPPSPSQQPGPRLPPAPSQPPMMQPPPQQPAPLLPPQQPSNYPMWGQQPPMQQQPPLQYPLAPAPNQMADQRQMPSRTSNAALKRKSSGLKPWMLVVGALVMAALAFAVTRAFIGGSAKTTVTEPK